MLPNRVLPSIDLVSPVHADYSVDLAEPEIERMRFMEIPTSGAVLQYWESGAFSLSAKEMFDILGGPSYAEQLGTPVVTRGTVAIDGKAFATLNLGFGSSVTARFVFAGDGAGSAGDPGSAPYARSSLLGGLVDLNAAGGERRFLMDYRGAEKAGSGAPLLFGLLSAAYTADSKAAQPGPSGGLVGGGPEPTEASPLSETTAPSPALFGAGWATGTQIAGGLSTPSADDAGVNALAEVAVHAPGNPADVLLTVDTVLPDARADLVRLQNAELAIVPTYVVGAAPATPLAPPRVDDRQDLSLAAQVVGLDEPPGDGSLTPASTDRFFEQLAWADSRRGVAASSLDLGGMQPGAIDVADAAQAAAQAQQSAVPTDAASAFRDWLDGLLQQGENGAVMVPVLALEGMMAFVCWRSLRPDRQATVQNPHEGRTARLTEI
ncbi:MAG TPA: hypothetical protein VGY66_36335 [Gemmataceae bacterium]|nr:hypothetical protein [Gemmataceae bacterium]